MMGNYDRWCKRGWSYLVLGWYGKRVKWFVFFVIVYEWVFCESIYFFLIILMVYWFIEFFIENNNKVFLW